MPESDDEADGTIFFALIGDLVGSRELEDRAGVQRSLLDVLEALNAELSPNALAAPLALSRGDEVQGLLAGPEAAVQIVVGIGDRLYPASMAWGLGAGGLATDPGREVSVLDGPCFHRARSALEAAREEGAWLRVRGFPPPHDEVLDALFRLMGAVRSRWTETQVTYIRGVRDALQKEVARRAGVSKSTVSQVLQNARFKEVREAESAVRALLRWLGSRGLRDPSELDE